MFIALRNFGRDSGIIFLKDTYRIILIRLEIQQMVSYEPLLFL